MQTPMILELEALNFQPMNGKIKENLTFLPRALVLVVTRQVD